MLFVSCYLWQRKSFSLFSIAMLLGRCVLYGCMLRGCDVCDHLFLFCGLFARLYCQVNFHKLTFEKHSWFAKVNCKCMKTKVTQTNTELISSSRVCSATCVTNRIHEGKTVARALQLIDFALLFLVSFHFFSVASRRQEKRASWVSVSLVLICADLALQVSLTSVTHTSHGRREQSVMDGRRVEMTRKNKMSLFGFRNAIRFCVMEPKQQASVWTLPHS